MNKDKVYLKGHVIGRAADTLGYQGLMVQLENLDVVEIDKNLVHKDINEPQKVTVPQFVADWITKAKTEGLKRKNSLGSYEELFPSDSAYSAMFSIFIKGFAIGEVRNWVAENTDTFALAWINGYEVEKEKRYTVKIKGKIEENLLVYGWGIKRYFFARAYNDSSRRGEHTHKELEENGFGWVFDCPGIDIEEVEE